MIIAIDPGFTGALAVIRNNGELIIEDLPIRLILNKKQIDEKAFHEQLKECVALANMVRDKPEKILAVLEDVWVMPEQGIVSSGRFMYNAGILLGAIAAYDMTIIKVKPNVWKPALGLDRNKAKSLALAKKIFPAYKEFFKLKKHDGRAEAALIAHFARISL